VRQPVVLGTISLFAYWPAFSHRKTVKRETSNGSELEERLTAKKGPRQIEFFWLCDDCSELMTLTFENGAV